jgi:hypothetical protein
MRRVRQERAVFLGFDCPLVEVTEVALYSSRIR